MKEKAFTLIELLLVITLGIALLAAVVLSVRNAQIKGRLSRIASDISEFRKVAEDIYYQEDSGYQNICIGGTLSSIDSRLVDIKKDIEDKMKGSILCYSDKENYCLSVDLPGVNYFYCLDSKGNFEKTDNNMCVNASSLCVGGP